MSILSNLQIDNKYNLTFTNIINNDIKKVYIIVDQKIGDKICSSSLHTNIKKYSSDEDYTKYKQINGYII